MSDGYFFVTGGGDPALDPVRWEVQAAAAGDGGAAGPWSAVGASGWRSDDTGALEPLPQLAFPAPLARGARVDVDQRLAWPTVLWTCLGPAACTATLVSAAAAGASGRERAVRPLLLCVVFIDMLLAGVGAAGLAALGDRRAAAALGLVLLSDAVALVGIAAYEARIVTVLIAYALSFIAVSLAGDLLFYAGAVTPPAALLALAPSSATLTLAFSLLVIVARRRTLARARALIVQDQACYDELWAALAASPDARGHLLAVREQVGALTAGLPSDPPRQCNRLPEGMPPRDADGVGGVGPLAGPSGPVDSLEQLFTQAACLQPLLLDKVRAWALASGGCFLVQGSDRYVRYADAVAADPAAAPLLKFAAVKSARRAIEKAVRAYGQVMAGRQAWAALPGGCRGARRLGRRVVLR